MVQTEWVSIVKQNKLIMSAAIYMALTFLLPIRRPIFVWQDAESSMFTWIVNEGQYYLMIFVIYIVAMTFNLKKFNNLMDKITQDKIMYPLGYFIMVSMLTLFIIKAPGLGWTWSTVGIHLMTVVLITVLLGKKIGSGRAFCLGTGFVFLIVGLWEIPYQYGMWKYYDLPQGYGIWSFYNQLRFMSPFVFFGLYIVAYILFMERKKLKYHKLVFIPLGYAVCSYLLWFATGFWCDIYFNWSINQWVHNDPNYLAMMLYRTSKVASAFIPIMLLVPIKEFWKKHE